MRPVTRLLLTGTFLLSLTGTFLLSLTGCGPLQRLIKSGDPRTYATAQGLVNQKQYVEAAAELRRLELELAPATTDKNGLTRYGDLVTEVTNRRVDRPLCDAESASRSAWSGAEAVSGLARAAAGFQAVEGLPLDRLHSKIRSRAALTARRAKLEEAVAFLLAGAEKQLELIREDVKAGRTGFALYEWSRFRPATEAQAGGREARLLELSRALFAAAGGTFPIEVDKAGASHKDASRPSPSFRPTRPTLQLSLGLPPRRSCAASAT